MKILFSSAARSARAGGAPAGFRSGSSAGASALAGVVMLGLLLQGAPVQAQPGAPAPNASSDRQWVAIDDQIVPATSVVRGDAHGHAHEGGAPLSFDASARKWPKGRVAYTYDPNMSAAKRALFESGCRDWEKYADLHFSPRAAEANYIVVTSTADASNSYIGMTGGPQVLNLADWANKGTVVHELAHALGIIHEQSRPDRDTYVTINTENITDGYAFAFGKINGALNQSPYDFLSVMHYYGTAFSKNGKNTITANAGYTQFQDVMGQRNGLSDGDKRGMALVYGAPGPNSRGIIKPDPPKTNDTLTATPIGNGAPEAYSYVWFKNGDVIAGETTNKLDLSKPGNGDKADTISVIISGPDEEGAATDQNASVVVLNSAPVVTPQVQTPPAQTANDAPYTGQLTGTDDDGDDLTFLVVTPADHGTLELNADGSYTYTPDAGFVGTDGFKVAANDGETSSLPETFSIKVTKPNNPPVFNDMSLRLTKDISVNTMLGATDPDGDALTYRFVKGALPQGVFLTSSGTLRGRPTMVQTTVATIVVTDARGNQTSAELTIEVKIDDRPPTVTARFAPASPKTNDVLTVTANVRNQTMGEVVVIYRFDVNGQRIQSGLSNTLDLSRFGRGDKGDAISCLVTATNEGGGQGSATVKTTVVNSAPLARGGDGEAISDVVSVFDIRGTDADNDELSIVILGQPANGRVATRKDKSGNLRLFYRSNRGFTGTERIRFSVSDGQANSAPASVFTITVKADPSDSNRAPRAKDVKVDTFVGQPLTVDLPVVDPDGGPLRVRIVKDALYGRAAINRDKNGKFQLLYNSPNRASANDRVTYVATDSKGRQSNEATVFINFVNRAPVADDSSLMAFSGEAVSQELQGRDPDRDELSFRLVTEPMFGTAQIARDARGVSRVTYTANEDYVGADRLTFVAVDAAGKKSAPATIRIDVALGNRAPVITTSGGFAAASGETVLATLEGNDPDGDAFSYRIVGGPDHGEAEITPDPGGLPSVRYKSADDYVGPDSVTIIAVDVKGKKSAPTTLTIDVVKANQNSSAGNALKSGAAPSAGNS